MFAFFEIEAPRRAADTRLAEVEEKKKPKGEPLGAAGGRGKKMSKGGGNTGALEKKKRKTDGGGALPKKRSRLIDAVLVQSPLRSKGGSEDKVESSGDSATVARSPAAPVNAALERAMPVFSLQFS